LNTSVRRTVTGLLTGSNFQRLTVLTASRSKIRAGASERART
jgi:hypothetical protein